MGILSSVIGLFFSYSYNLASGATIVLTAALFFLLAFLFLTKERPSICKPSERNGGNQRMKKFSLFFLTLLAGLTLAACGNQAAERKKN